MVHYPKLAAVLLAAGALANKAVDDTSATCAANGECAESGEALLQRAGGRSKAVVTEHTELTEHKHKKQTLDSDVNVPLSKNAAVREVTVSKSEDEKTATVSFEHRGVQFNHKLSAVSMYSENARVVRHTDDGEIPIDVSKSNQFKSREAGRWASATLHEDGSVSGFFEDNGRVVRVDPASRHEPASEVSSLLQDFNGKGIGHLVQFIALPEVGSSRKEMLASLAQQKADIVAEQVKNQGDGFTLAVDKDKTGTFGTDIEEAEEEEYLAEAMQGNWAGNAWTPGCYSGDSQAHVYKIKIIGDQPLYQKWGRQTRQQMEEAIFEASFVYEKQMNFKLEIEQLEIYESTHNAPTSGGACNNNGDFMENKLFALQEEEKRASASTLSGGTQLFTGCGTGYGTVGLAYITAACDTTGYGIGVNQLHSSRSWVTVCHEIGHNLGAEHSFELGQGKTGGIMDYGDGKLEGTYQFNTRFRKEQVCQKLNNMKLTTCNGGKFVVDPNGGNSPSPGPGPIPVFPTPWPTPPPTPAPTTACVDSPTWRSYWGYSCWSYSDRWCWHPTIQQHCKAKCRAWGTCGHR